MPVNVTAVASATSLTMLRPLLVALEAEHRATLRPLVSLPAPTFWAEHARVLLAATPIIEPPMFRLAMRSAAKRLGHDALVVRHGVAPEILDAVEYDLVLARGGRVMLLWGLHLYRHPDGALWLVPGDQQRQLFVRLQASGLLACAWPPYADLDQRDEGVARAARETVLALRQLRRR